MIVVFDLDGTLVDASKLHAKILSDIIGKKIDSSLVYAASSLRFLIMKHLPGEKWTSIKDITRQHEAEMLKNVGLVEPMPGVYEMLQKLKFKKAIFTSADKRLTKAILKNTYLGDYFDKIITADDVVRSKPDPEGLMLISNAFPRHKMVVVGNSDRDILAAKKMDVASVMFSPAGNTASLADYTVSKLNQIPELVESLKE